LDLKKLVTKVKSCPPPFVTDGRFFRGRGGKTSYPEVSGFRPLASDGLGLFLRLGSPGGIKTIRKWDRKKGCGPSIKRPQSFLPGRTTFFYRLDFAGLDGVRGSS